MQVLEGVVGRRVLLGGVFQLQHAEWQAVHEHHDIRPAVVLAFDHCELIDGKPVVGRRVIEIDHPHAITGDAVTTLAPVFDLDAVAQHGVKPPVRSDQRGSGNPQHFPHSVLACLLRDGRIQPTDGVPQPANQHYLPKRITLRLALPRRQVRPKGDAVAQLPEPFEGGGFDREFVEAHTLTPPAPASDF